MGPLIAVALGATGVVLFFVPALVKADTRRRRRTDPRYRPMGSFGVVDELFHPTAYSAFQEAEAEQELPAPAPSPGDLPRRRTGR
ncbi:hypothetical protein HD599_000089 [Conyzicola lurida]|uniref:Uncharacterized protein n=1 Tax=Conyzicola lurida TaxID=1172621 RepID=A0A841AJ54_9MICO|nr:hypothetical protein [Conyzicola lurida]MBB5841766.1 hypothetical protein [Conyzicola lurida]